LNRLLIDDFDANIEAVDVRGRTPLHIATSVSSDIIAEELLEVTFFPGLNALI